MNANPAISVGCNERSHWKTTVATRFHVTMSVRYIRLEGNVENEIECNKTITTSFSTIYYPVITTVIIVYLFFFFL